MPPCKKICMDRLMPTPAPAAGGACPAVGGACPVAPVPSVPAPAEVADCSCDEEPMLTCDEDTCANAADCKQLCPEICPHGLATDDDRSVSQSPTKPELTHLICPHCQSHIAMYDDDLKQPQPDSRQSQTRNTFPAQKQPFNAAGQFCHSNCPFTEDIKHQSTNSPAPSRGNSTLRTPHISQIKVTRLTDLQDPQTPEPPDGATSCCTGGKATHRAPHMGRTSEDPKSYSDMDGDERSESPDPKGLKVDSSGKGKDEQNLPGSQSQCPRSAAAQLFPARPAPRPCLCRMPPAYRTGCTGNLSGNCNCTSCNK